MSDGLKFYLVENDHTDEACPTQTEDGLRLVEDIVEGKEHAARSGVAVLAFYVAVGTHRSLTFLAAENIQNGQQYAEPFRKLGPTTVTEIIRGETLIHDALKEYKH